MIRTEFSRAVEIPSPRPLVWSVMADAERWPAWTPSVSRVKRLSPSPLRVGSRLRIHQPKLPPALWRVTELSPGAGFASVSRAPGVSVTARHALEPISIGTGLTLSIRYEGLLGPWLAKWTGDLNERYLRMEGDGLKARCAETAGRPFSQCHEAH